MVWVRNTLFTCFSGGTFLNSFTQLWKSNQVDGAPIVHTLSEPFSIICHYTYHHGKGYVFEPSIWPLVILWGHWDVIYPRTLQELKANICEDANVTLDILVL